MKLAWRRSKDIPVSAGRGLTGPERAAALGMVDESEPEAELELTPAAAAPAAPGPVMLTLTTRSKIEQAEREATEAAARPVRRRIERGALGGSAPTGGGCSSGGCG
ncbi:hypothetical protein FRAAL1123 [Frankia alni ACN14a]|uniref:Uncharacterized protein n=1 Tax=Frankia alni (strain DSM 45986 / CECT 9034 / ACN14a) TaxID=326424 RepID=Q0RRN0_FRAAA|nr:hypothetical protein FRAAL1123 [Frankia alni ACN14a]